MESRCRAVDPDEGAKNVSSLQGAGRCPLVGGFMKPDGFRVSDTAGG